jgi:outer membrane biosynthesis protein TonB
MQNLLIEQKGPEGLIKTWRLTENQGTLTFGNSKHADLRSPINSVNGIQGMFECREGKWYYINLDLHSDLPQLKNGLTDICLDQPIEFKMGVSHLTITPFDSRSQLFAQFDHKTDLITPMAGKKPYQLFTVYQGKKLLETCVIEVHQTFTSQYDLNKTKLTPVKSESWMKTPVGDLDINQRTVYLNNVDALRMMTKDQVIDEGGKKTLYATLAGAVLLALLFIISPKTEEVVEIAPPPMEFREVTPPPPKKKAQSAPKVEEVQQPQQAAAPKQDQPAPQQMKAQAGGSSKAASAIKSLASGRITQLIGKVSATAARSNNVVVTSGIAAGTAPSGRAMAAVGAISKSGTDWSSEGKGTGIKISTNGVAGGKGVGGMGTLAAGTTGTGGVGLLEDEGEITGGLDREVIAQYIKSKLGEILYCYERQLSANPDLYGKVAVKFSIGGNGAVETQRIGDTTLRNAMVEGCILQKVSKWKFPTPDGGTKVLVTYPFLFKSTN